MAVDNVKLSQYFSFSVANHTVGLVFGKGISLTVNPRGTSPSLPSLSILSPLSHSGDADATYVCLATGFFPKEAQMQLTLHKETTVSLPTNRAVMSFTSKSYYFAGFSTKFIQSCSMNGITAEKTYLEPVITPAVVHTTAEPTVESLAPNCSVDTVDEEIEYTDFIMKINFTSLLVNGLRVIFVKAVTFNVLLTVKALVF